MNYGHLDYQAWCKETDEKTKIENEQRNAAQTIQKKYQLDEITSFRNKHGDYWYCECVDTWVHYLTTTIPSIDGVNDYFLMGIDSDDVEQTILETLLGKKEMPTPYTIDEYHEKYCEKDDEKDDEKDRWVLSA